MTVGKCEWWYVAAQGPKPDTVVDFWQMVWEQEIQVIAMLTDLIVSTRNLYMEGYLCLQVSFFYGLYIYLF